jgi:hypothetical protein
MIIRCATRPPSMVSITLMLTPFAAPTPATGITHKLCSARHCGFIYANPALVGQMTCWRPIRPLKTSTYVAERIGRELTFRQPFAASRESGPGPANGRSLLDVGAYIGVFVEVANEAGWDAMRRGAIRLGGGRGAEAACLKVIVGTQDSPELPAVAIRPDHHVGRDRTCRQPGGRDGKSVSPCSSQAAG